jgi:hypothetical protein
MSVAAPGLKPLPYMRLKRIGIFEIPFGRDWRLDRAAKVKQSPARGGRLLDIVIFSVISAESNDLQYA